MENSWLWLALLLAPFASILVKWLFHFFLTLHRLPPGPWGLPVVGYLPWLSEKPFEDFVRLGKQYGGIFSLRMGSEMAVVLNDWPAIKATLVDQGRTFSGRKFSILSNIFFNKQDVIFSDGDVWRQQRKLTVQSIKKVSVQNKQSMESRFSDMIHQMTDEMRKLDGQSVDIAELIGDCMAQGNWSLISYIDVAESQSEMRDLRSYIHVLSQTIRLGNPLGALPWLRFLPPNGFGFWEATNIGNRFREYLKTLIKKHYDQLDTGNDVIDHYIQEINNNPGGKAPYNDEHLLGSVVDLITASHDTTTATCLWGLLYLVLNPRVQDKVREELERVVGKERLLTMDDFHNLPYLDAFVKEVHRKGSVVPLSVPHSNSKTARVNGYVIPKGTQCIQNIYAVHNDPELWEEPEVFKPERFIGEDGSAITPPYLMPFSVGPRACLGQFVAEAELRLVFGNLIQQFAFCLPPDRPEPSLEPIVGASLKPKPFHVLIRSKNE